MDEMTNHLTMRAMRSEGSMMGVPTELAALDAAISALSAPAAPAGEVELIAGCVAEAIENGDGFRRSCSGCHETSDGHNVQGFPYSPTFRGHLGGGCRECGGVGAVWLEINDKAMLGWESAAPSCQGCAAG